MKKRRIDSGRMTRRVFTKKLSLAALAVGMPPSLPGLSSVAAPRTHRVLVMSDIHVGRNADHQDGGTWLGRSLEDVSRRIGSITYGLTLGDMTHHGDRSSLERYLTLRDQSSVAQWFELAGNHEYHGRGIHHYHELVGSTGPRCVVDGNIAWFLLSDENRHAPGNVTPRTYRWLRDHLDRHRDKLIVFCSHQLLPNTLRRSNEGSFCLHPRDKIKRLFEDFPIAVALCGHEHHQPYAQGSMMTKNGTTYINVASVTHAYDTGSSGSLVLEFEENSKEIVARRRNHDRQSYDEAFRIAIPTSKPIRLGEAVHTMS